MEGDGYGPGPFSRLVPSALGEALVEDGVPEEWVLAMGGEYVETAIDRYARTMVEGGLAASSALAEHLARLGEAMGRGFPSGAQRQRIADRLGLPVTDPAEVWQIAPYA